MYLNYVSRFLSGFLLILTLIILTGNPGFCQDRIGSNLFGPGFHILPITSALMEMPMPISFNGISGTSSYSDTREKMGKNGIPGNRVRAGVRFSMPTAGINAGLARIRNSLFRYIQDSGPGGQGDVLAVDESEDFETGSAIDTGDISLEFQADITDMSGALFFVMKI